MIEKTIFIIEKDNRICLKKITLFEVNKIFTIIFLRYEIGGIVFLRTILTLLLAGISGTT